MGRATRDMFLAWFPGLPRRFGSQAIYALMDDPLLDAFGFPHPPPPFRDRGRDRRCVPAGESSRGSPPAGARASGRDAGRGRTAATGSSRSSARTLEHR